jgi:uncharacterized protein YoxC
MNNQAVSYDDHARVTAISVASQELAASFAALQQSVEQLSQSMQALLQAAQEMLHSIQSLLETTREMVLSAGTERRDTKRRTRRDGASGNTRSRNEPGSTNDGAGSSKSVIECTKR